MQEHQKPAKATGTGEPAAERETLGFVLSVDDDRLNQKVAKIIVEAAGFTFVGVNSGDQCMRALETLQPQIILLDIMMPGLDGFETCRRIRQHFRGAGPRIIFVTARNLVEDIKRAMNVEADDYLVKPIEMQSLHARLMHWIKQNPRAAHA